ncbi:MULTISPECIES: hypothetical protein [Ralstonia solanacearum species complex]|uniref:HEPN AbiU2-like domain-containing protein n=2 Tax=Ralstonia solanacearum TaxID=305 RepID=A0ABF7RDK0_RALSL|nr:hypothetical protein [Ralstonia solanacearum]ALF88466.1 hypothetical protein RSUY_21350 [Ralstonia solanacearum]ATI27917.1 hypothetical protein CCY86_10680 [Ralstonia solanacearum]ATJ86674.1 hypothetical protein CDC59_10605 [Ralstonia solanacearum]EAP74216.1 Hypothetical Protein RRSL_03935 [Ralstonia solanacearum UW551]KEI30906.1 hypothetical protein CQ06_02415 [Ralstonia solanacearum]
MVQPVDSRFPEPVQEIWATIWSDVTWLHGRWQIYRQLFGISKARIDLFNETASTVASILHDVLLRDVQIAICKLGDSAKSGRSKNLTLRRLQSELRDAGEIDVADQMGPLLDTFETASKAVRDRRNKWIAHSDLDTLLEARTKPLHGPSRQEIETILTALRDVMHCVEDKYTGGTTAHERLVMNHTGEHVINAFARAKRYEELVKEGRIPRDDFRRRFPSGL